MHFWTREFIIKISFRHKFSCLNTFYKLIIIKIGYNNFQLMHTPIIQHTTFFSNSFWSFYFYMIILWCKNQPNLLCYSYKIIILLLFLINNSIEIIILIKRDLIKSFVISNQIEVNLSRMFLTNLFMFFLIILRQVVISDVLLPVFKPFCTYQVTIV